MVPQDPDQKDDLPDDLLVEVLCMDPSSPLPSIDVTELDNYLHAPEVQASTSVDPPIWQMGSVTVTPAKRPRTGAAAGKDLSSVVGVVEEIFPSS